MIDENCMNLVLVHFLFLLRVLFRLLSFFPCSISPISIKFDQNIRQISSIGFTKLTYNTKHINETIPYISIHYCQQIMFIAVVLISNQFYQQLNK